jgi:hypothetical protein
MRRIWRRVDGMKATPTLGRRAVVAARRKFARPARRRTLYDLFKDFDGLLTDLSADFASNHDHYLYGSPRV